jgi:hypothetical protein
MCVYRGKCSYVYEYLHLYCVSKKKLDHLQRERETTNLSSPIFISQSRMQISGLQIGSQLQRCPIKSNPDICIDRWDPLPKKQIDFCISGAWSRARCSTLGSPRLRRHSLRLVPRLLVTGIAMFRSNTHLPTHASSNHEGDAIFYHPTSTINKLLEWGLDRLPTIGCSRS